MYDKQQIKDLQKGTESWLDEKHPTSVNEKNVEALRDILRFHEYRYYVQNDPLISDYEYDMLFKKLEHFEKENPSLITKDSPTQRVGKGLIKDFPKTQHLVPMQIGRAHV